MRADVVEKVLKRLSDIVWVSLKSWDYGEHIDKRNARRKIKFLTIITI
jgi:hypothetical protein|tara:strand:- start:295 stop:438 length:144 start_codon:yes stop_codon:yes gene_type:complete